MAAGPWPTWARYTATAAIAFGGGIVAVTLTVSEIRATAARADETSKDHEPRIRRLESDTATDRADLRALKEAMAEVRGDVKELLRRTPQK